MASWASIIGATESVCLEVDTGMVMSTSCAACTVSALSLVVPEYALELQAMVASSARSKKPGTRYARPRWPMVWAESFIIRSFAFAIWLADLWPARHLLHRRLLSGLH